MLKNVQTSLHLIIQCRNTRILRWMTLQQTWTKTVLQHDFGVFLWTYWDLKGGRYRLVITAEVCWMWSIDQLFDLQPATSSILCIIRVPKYPVTPCWHTLFGTVEQYKLLGYESIMWYGVKKRGMGSLPGELLNSLVCCLLSFLKSSLQN